MRYMLQFIGIITKEIKGILWRRICITREEQKE